jgi:hypothetical protein
LFGEAWTFFDSENPDESSITRREQEETLGGRVYLPELRVAIVSRVTGRQIRVVEISSEQAEHELLKVGIIEQGAGRVTNDLEAGPTISILFDVRTRA